MLYICVFSNKFDLKQAIHVLHTVVQQFLRNPAPWPCIHTTFKKWIKSFNFEKWKKNRRWTTKLSLLKNGGRQNRTEEKRKQQWQATGTRICVFTVSASITGRRNAEPWFKINSPAWITEEENTGPNDTLSKKRRKDLSHRFRHSQITSHHWWEAGWWWRRSYSTYAWPH